MKLNKARMPLASSLLFLIAITLSGCGEPQPTDWKITGYTMGTSYHVTVADPKQLSGLDKEQLTKKIERLLKLVNQQMSTYIDDSDLSRFNQAPINTDVQTSAELAGIVERSLQIYAESDHSFDPTIGALVNVWGFGPDHHPDHIPSKEIIAKLLRDHGMNKVSVDLTSHSLRKTAPVYVDLSAIAKGDGVDRVARLLEQLGAKDFLVEIGGELRAKGLSPRGSDWRIAIEEPASDAAQDSVYRAISISDVSVATSGDYRNYFEENGQRYSHTIDPRTGYPITHALASVTVVADNCRDADAYATAISVLGPEQGMAFAEKMKLAVYLLVKEGDGFIAISSTAFEPYLIKE
ncbi:FAD:protein FMN transferase [Sinobacterium caligoides]|uniref:FAD:protein FMN transferase n=1 Tax=Sinobacterium caligoides TaxID=933926 RepID=UPI001FE312EB|nr:FAD:protein FMN transferase [Sinobacterium caligoides]